MQIVGAMVALAGTIGFFFHEDDMILFFAFIFFSIGILLCSISREKIEDEFISYLRTRSIFLVVMVYLVWAVIDPVLSYYVAPRAFDLSSWGRVSFVLGFLRSAQFFVLIYLLLFKGAIMLNSRKEDAAA